MSSPKKTDAGNYLHHINRLGAIPDTEDEKRLIKTWRAWNAIITHGNLWHRSGTIKQMKRIAILCSFCASFINQIAFRNSLEYKKQKNQSGQETRTTDGIK